MMWARICEVALASWLAMSPFIFRYESDAAFFWWNDYICAFAICVFSLGSFFYRVRKLHLPNLLVASWLVAYGWLTASEIPAPPTNQNYIVVGILLFLFAIIPNRHDEPPVPWQEFYRERARAEGQNVSD